MNLEVIDRLIEQDPTLESSRPAFEAMKEGACCIHRSWGFGQISGFESERGMILIDFDEMRRGVEPHTTLKNWIRNLQKRWKEEKENPKVSDFAKWNRSIPTSQ